MGMMPGQGMSAPKASEPRRGGGAALGFVNNLLGVQLGEMVRDRQLARNKELAVHKEAAKAAGSSVVEQERTKQKKKREKNSIDNMAYQTSLIDAGKINPSQVLEPGRSQATGLNNRPRKAEPTSDVRTTPVTPAAGTVNQQSVPLAGSTQPNTPKPVLGTNTTSVGDVSKESLSLSMYGTKGGKPRKPRSAAPGTTLPTFQAPGE